MRTLENLARTGKRGYLHFALTVTGMVMASMGLLAACSGSGGAYGNDGGSSSTSTGGPSDGAVKTRTASDLGTLLTDSSGKTLYTPEQEAKGKISCTGACTEFWFPVTTKSKHVSSSTKLPGELGTLKRPDTGKLQVTYNHLPLYTFKLDTKPGDTKGNDFSDTFEGTKFTWYAMTTKGTTEGGEGSSAPSSSSDTGGGYKY